MYLRPWIENYTIAMLGPISAVHSKDAYDSSDSDEEPNMNLRILNSIDSEFESFSGSEQNAQIRRVRCVSNSVRRNQKRQCSKAQSQSPTKKRSINTIDIEFEISDSMRMMRAKLTDACKLAHFHNLQSLNGIQNNIISITNMELKISCNYQLLYIVIHEFCFKHAIPTAMIGAKKPKYVHEIQYVQLLLAKYKHCLFFDFDVSNHENNHSHNDSPMALATIMAVEDQETEISEVSDSAAMNVNENENENENENGSASEDDFENTQLLLNSNPQRLDSFGVCSEEAQMIEIIVPSQQKQIHNNANTTTNRSKKKMAYDLTNVDLSVLAMEEHGMEFEETEEAEAEEAEAEGEEEEQQQKQKRTKKSNNKIKTNKSKSKKNKEEEQEEEEEEEEKEIVMVTNGNQNHSGTKLMVVNEQLPGNQIDWNAFLYPSKKDIPNAMMKMFVPLKDRLKRLMDKDHSHMNAQNDTIPDTNAVEVAAASAADQLLSDSLCNIASWNSDWERAYAQGEQLIQRRQQQNMHNNNNINHNNHMNHNIQAKDIEDIDIIDADLNLLEVDLQKKKNNSDVHIADPSVVTDNNSMLSLLSYEESVILTESDDEDNMGIMDASTDDRRKLVADITVADIKYVYQQFMNKRQIWLQKNEFHQQFEQQCQSQPTVTVSSASNK